ncbi:endo-1,4-beta-xylanase [Halosimplex litoreum]|uniref:endo-1,4-beta-xylanase n=1 Tax=Halosimplex litoreum TaxID=1198301 RepID=A0A7T3FY29_9EURY|nr:endo-1,4-beta-xylanase [Halosimplex litoreum]QPV62801.1 endo-1,4-beta-xylanase [Halosimplex litoreum]
MTDDTTETDDTRTDENRTDDERRPGDAPIEESPGRRVEKRERNDMAPADASDGFGMSRRDWMRTLGAAIAAGGAGAAASGAAAGETADTSKTVDQRIQEHRTGDLQVTVENEDGSAVSGAEVSVTQQSHDFNWGTAVHADTLINQSSAGDNYREYIPELFNTAVIENQMKWAIWESDTQLADDAVNWLLDQGLDVRGHVCVYGVDYAVPSDVQTAIDSGDTQSIREQSMAHIDEIVNHYGNDIHEWEVVNEVQHSTTIIDPFTSTPETADIVADWYQRAEAVRPSGVTLAANDYNAIAGNYGSDQRGYKQHINHLLDNGVDLETTGLQCHFGQNQTLSTDQILATLNEYGQLTDTLKVTEYDQAGSGWPESQKADWFERFLRVTFSHPGVESFLVWGFWDGRHWENDAPFFDDDWSTKPSYDVWMDLVYGEWWTETSGTTDSEGTFATGAFLGEQQIEVSTDSDSATVTRAVTSPDGTTTVTVTVSGDGTGDDTDGGDDTDDGDDTAGEQQPYNGTPHAIPGRIQAEEYDQGGSGVAYSDTTAENEGTSFRTDQGVDVSSNSAGSGYSIGYIESGEWVEFTVDVAQAGDYTLDALVASNAGGGAFHVEVGGTDVSGTVGVPDTGGWDSWETVSTSGVSLDAGQQVIRVAMDESWWDLNYLEFSLDSSSGDGSDGGDGTDGDDGTDGSDGDDGNDGSSGDLVAEIDPDTTSAAVGERVAFRVTDTTGSGNWIDSLSWTLGNGDTGAGWYTDTTYDSAGSYTVQLDATNDEGETTTDTVTVDVS